MVKREREYATTAEVARSLGVSEVSVRKYAASGELPAFRVGSRWRFNPKDVREFCAQRTQQIVTEKATQQE